MVEKHLFLRQMYHHLKRWKKCSDFLMKSLGRSTFLVNNAGIAEGVPFTEMTDGQTGIE